MCQEDENGGKIRYVGRKIHILSHQLKRRRMMCEQEDGSLTATQRSVLNHILLRSMVEDVYQRDIEKEFHINRATASGMLTLMEQKGMIQRSSVSHDARLKKLELTPLGLELHEGRMKWLQQLELTIEGSLTREELETFQTLTDKIRQVLEQQVQITKEG